MEVKYNKVLEDGYCGRNGTAKMESLNIWKDESRDIIWLEPVNSRGYMGSCWIRLPIEHIQDLINELEKLK